jgi:two-component system, cell cycle sensor histidine kinase and response regulator CckA
VVVEIKDMLQRLLADDIELCAALESDIGRVKADQGQIEQVIMNIAVNARDAMPQGGRLMIKTANVWLNEESPLDPGDPSPGRYVMLTITDSGEGMDDQTRMHIFEPFFTTKEMGKGTGLGLSTVYGIIRQSGGNIQVSSQLDVGTTFSIYLPCVDEDRQLSED